VLEHLLVSAPCRAAHDPIDTAADIEVGWAWLRRHIAGRPFLSEVSYLAGWWQIDVLVED
jgi:hypothetical protein